MSIGLGGADALVTEDLPEHASGPLPIEYVRRGAELWAQAEVSLCLPTR